MSTQCIEAERLPTPKQLQALAAWKNTNRHIPKVSMPAETVISAVETRYGIPPGGLHLRTNEAWVSRPRHIAMYALNKFCGHACSRIGRLFKMHHTSVMYGISKINLEREYDKDLDSTLISLEEALNA